MSFFTCFFSAYLRMLFLFTAFKRIGILAFKFNYDGGADRLEFFSEKVGQITPVNSGYFFYLVAMNNDPGRIHAALVRITQFYPAAVDQWRLM